MCVCLRERQCVCMCMYTHALVLGKPMDSSTSRVDPCLTVLGRLWRCLRGVTLAYRSSLAAIIHCSIGMPGLLACLHLLKKTCKREEWKLQSVQTRVTWVKRRHVENTKPSGKPAFPKCYPKCKLDQLPPDVSHMKSKPSAVGSAMGSHFCCLCPRFTVPKRGEHVWFLLASRIRSAEWEIICDCMNFLSYLWMDPEWAELQPVKGCSCDCAAPLIKGTVRRLREGRKSVRSEGGVRWNLKIILTIPG